MASNYYFNSNNLPRFHIARTMQNTGAVFNKTTDTAIVGLQGDMLTDAYEGIMRASGIRGKRKRLNVIALATKKDEYIRATKEEILVLLGTVVLLEMTKKRNHNRMLYIRERLDIYIQALLDQGVNNLSPEWSLLHNGCSIMINPCKLVELNTAFKRIKNWYTKRTAGLC